MRSRTRTIPARPVAGMLAASVATALAAAPLPAQPTTSRPAPGAQGVTLERRTDVPCELPAAGWSNLFFSGDSTAAAGRRATFGGATADPRLEIVERRDAAGARTFTARVTPTGDERTLAFALLPSGYGCATIQVEAGPGGAPVRVQVAASADEPWVYGRVAEYRVGQLPTADGPLDVEVWPTSQRALRFDDLATVTIFVAAGPELPIQRQTVIEDAPGGRLMRPTDEVHDAFARVGYDGETRRFTVDSLAPGGTRLHLTGIGDVAHAALGFRAPELTGRRLDGTPFRLPDADNRYTVVEFWSTDCPFSARARPEVRRLAAALEARGSRFVTMARETDTAAVRRHLEEHPRGGIALVQDGATWARWNPQTVTPLFFVIAHDRTVLLREAGASAVRLLHEFFGVGPDELESPASGGGR